MEASGETVHNNEDDEPNNESLLREMQVGDAIRMAEENRDSSRITVANYESHRLCLDLPSVERIIACIQRTPRIWMLVLDCIVGEESAVALQNFLRDTQQITSLDITGAYNRNFETMSESSEENMLEVVSRALSENESINTLQLSSCELESERAHDSLAELFRHNQNLERIEFLQCHFGNKSKDLEFMTRALAYQTESLRDLTWNRCGLKDSQTATLIRAIQKHQIPLRRVEFCWCGMASESLRALIGYLKDPSPATRALQILDVNFNTNLFLNASVKKEFLNVMKYRNHTLLELLHAEATISVFFDLGNPDEIDTQDFRRQVDKCLQRNGYLFKVQDSLKLPSSTDNMGLWAKALGLLASEETGSLASFHILNALSTKFVEYLIPLSKGGEN